MGHLLVDAPPVGEDHASERYSGPEPVSASVRNVSPRLYITYGRGDDLSSLAA
jgi:hypothetical protein